MWEAVRVQFLLPETRTESRLESRLVMVVIVFVYDTIILLQTEMSVTFH